MTYVPINFANEGYVTESSNRKTTREAVGGTLSYQPGAKTVSTFVRLTLSDKIGSYVEVGPTIESGCSPINSAISACPSMWR